MPKDLKMEDEIPLQPDTPWGTEVRTRMQEKGQGFDEAFTQVMERYFNRGVAEPLVDLLQRGRRAPSQHALKFLAATIDPAHSSSSGLQIRYRLGIDENRRAGRPKRGDADALNAQKKHAVLILRAGTLTLAEGRNPVKPFWNCLIGALNAEAHWWPQNRFPLKAKLVRIDRRRGREVDPQLDTRDRVLAWFVQERVSRGYGYESAIRSTWEMLKSTGDAERWPGKIGPKTIKDAYDSHCKSKRPG
jgi:hypothetical protein